jgi:SAM-dependent methyltransferase
VTGVHPVAEAFRAVPELYERSRPGYPDAAMDWLSRRLGLGAGRVVADVAAGTGKLTRRLVETGSRVIAVEPLDEMRAVLARLVPEAEAVAGRAEALPLDSGSVDAVLVAQAFHWFDPEPALRELGRVLRPGGALALVWNKRDLTDPLQARLEALLRLVRAGAPCEHEQPWRPTVEASPLFEAAEERSFPWETAYTRGELAERIESISFVVQLPEEERAQLLHRVATDVEGLPDPLPFRYRTDVVVLPRAQETAFQGTPPVSQPTRQ